MRSVSSQVGHRVHLVDLAVAGGGERGSGDQGLQHRAAGVPGGERERVEDRLPPRRAPRLGHDRRDDVDQLGQAGDGHPVGVPEQGDQQAADDHRVVHVVDVLEQGRSLDKRLRLGEPAAVPDVPLVEAERDPPGRSAHGGHVVRGRHHGGDEALHVGRAGQEGRVVTLHRLVVGVGGDVVDHVEAVLEHDPFPGAERGHGRVAGTARHQLDAGVDQPHRPGGLLGQPPVRVGRPVADLPRPVHLVAEAPEAHRVRLGPAVGDPAVRQPAAGLGVAVLQELDRLDQTAGPEVDREHRRDPDPLAPLQEVVGADLVGFEAAPGEVQGGRAVLAGSDAVLPDVVGHEVAAGVADQGDPELGDQVRDVRTEAVRVGGGVAGLVDAGVDAPA